MASAFAEAIVERAQLALLVTFTILALNGLLQFFPQFLGATAKLTLGLAGAGATLFLWEPITRALGLKG